MDYRDENLEPFSPNVLTPPKESENCLKIPPLPTTTPRRIQSRLQKRQVVFDRKDHFKETVGNILIRNEKSEVTENMSENTHANKGTPPSPSSSSNLVPLSKIRERIHSTVKKKKKHISTFDNFDDTDLDKRASTAVPSSLRKIRERIATNNVLSSAKKSNREISFVDDAPAFPLSTCSPVQEKSFVLHRPAETRSSFSKNYKNPTNADINHCLEKNLCMAFDSIGLESEKPHQFPSKQNRFDGFIQKIVAKELDEVENKIADKVQNLMKFVQIEYERLLEKEKELLRAEYETKLQVALDEKEEAEAKLVDQLFLLKNIAKELNKDAVYSQTVLEVQNKVKALGIEDKDNKNDGLTRNIVESVNENNGLVLNSYHCSNPSDVMDSKNEIISDCPTEFDTTEEDTQSTPRKDLVSRISTNQRGSAIKEIFYCSPSPLLEKSNAECYDKVANQNCSSPIEATIGTYFDVEDTYSGGKNTPVRRSSRIRRNSVSN